MSGMIKDVGGLMFERRRKNIVRVRRIEMDSVIFFLLFEGR